MYWFSSSGHTTTSSLVLDEISWLCIHYLLAIEVHYDSNGIRFTNTQKLLGVATRHVHANKKIE